MPTSSIGFWCSIAAHQYFARLQQKLEGLDITQWYFVLLTIDEGEGAMSQQELADKLQLDKVAMTRALDHLGEKGYVERYECVGDRRKHLIKLTTKAKPAVKAIRKAYEELNEEALAGLTKNERTLFLEQLIRMAHYLKPFNGGVTVTSKRIHT